MKILIIDQIYSVSYKYTSSLALALQKSNEVFIAGDFSDPNILEGDTKKPTLFHFFSTSKKNVSKIRKLVNYWVAYSKILKIIKKEKIDAVYAQWFSCSPIDYHFLRKIRKKAKLLIAINDILPFDKKRFDYHFLKQIYSLPSHIIVMASSNVDRFQKLFPPLAQKVVFVPLGNVLKFGERVSKEDAEDFLGIPKGKFVFLFFGQIKKVKGIDYLLDAFIELSKKREDLFLIIAGKPWKEDVEKFQKKIADSGLRNIRTNFSYIPDENVKYYYGSADVCLLPYSDVYQSGVVQLTYAFFKPAIVSDLQPFLDVVIDGKNGFVCQRGSTESLRLTMEKASNTPKSEMDDMVTNGRRFIEQNFDWEKIAEQTEKLWRC